VEARYGAIHAGDDAWLHGWIVSRHRHAAEGDVVPHLR